MKNTVLTFKNSKEQGKKLSMLTAYDYSMAKIIDESGVDGILVGDSLGMVIKGEDDTLSVTEDEIIYHTKAVKKGAKFVQWVIIVVILLTAAALFDLIDIKGIILSLN